jgi:hypothetical protein
MGHASYDEGQEEVELLSCLVELDHLQLLGRLRNYLEHIVEYLASSQSEEEASQMLKLKERHEDRVFPHLGD